MRTRFSAALGLVLTANLAMAQSELQKQLKDFDIAPHWIYDDLPKAIAEAKATGKPLMVVLRCVPCPPGKTLDGQMMKPDPETEKFQKQFVCVRIVQTKGLDLKIFQYDYDQSWAAMFLNADMTIYGRYGTRTSTGPQSDYHLSLGSFRKAAERALELHKGYPANKPLLAAKIGKDPEYPRPEEIPSLKDRAGVETTRQNCIHCHMVREHVIRLKWLDNKLTVADLRPFPMPDNAGVIIDEDHGLKVKSIVEGSPAAKAGLAVGDELVSMDGQRLISLADIQWVLHRAPDEAKLPVTVKRGDRTVDATLSLSGNWKESDIWWRASSGYGLKRGLWLVALSADEKKKRGIEPDKMGLLIRNLYTIQNSTLPKVGFKVNDVIVALDGKSEAKTESQFLVDMRVNHGPGTPVKFTVLRGNERIELNAPLW